MFEAGNILYGYFDLGSNGKKNKYAIVLHNDPLECIITTFTTSQPRSSVASPVHGRNPSQGEVMSYVFKSGVSIGVNPLSGEFFFFRKDTTIVPDYGVNETTISSFCSVVDNLRVVCKLHEKEYIDLIYTLYKCKRTKRKYKLIFESILHGLGGGLSCFL